jgi:hypothetical protein
MDKGIAKTPLKMGAEANTMVTLGCLFQGPSGHTECLEVLQKTCLISE